MSDLTDRDLWDLEQSVQMETESLLLGKETIRQNYFFIVEMLGLCSV